MAQGNLDAPLIRWLALAAAGGAAAVLGLDLFGIDGPWAPIALVLALLAVVAIAGAQFAYRRRAAALIAEASVQQVESAAKQVEFSALKQELEQQKRLEQQLIEAKQIAEAAMLAKGEFLATMSHEIRTPLNGIIPMLDLLQSSPLKPDQQDLVKTAFGSAHQLLRIVDDILDYSKLEANKLQLESVGLNLREVLDSVVRLMEKPAERKGLRLNLNVDPALRLAVRGDPTRLRQVLTNLVSNAIKFTERGSVSISASRRGETPSHHLARFEVRDTGIGITREAADKLFSAFSQADASTTRIYGGTGLGLAISRRIVELMGGKIGVDSEAGKGSVFWFEIPLLKTVGEIEGPRRELSGSRVLVLTADPGLQRRLSIAMPNWGVTATIVSTTQDALDRLRGTLARGPGQTFQLLLADVGQARNSALALHRNIRRMQALDSLRIIYLHGDDPLPDELAEPGRVLMLPRTLPESELRVMASSHLSGGVDLPGSAPPEITTREPDLSEELAAIAAAPSPGMRPSPTPEAAAPTPAAEARPARAEAGRLAGRVLLVEDNPVNMMVAQRLLGLLGIECDTAANGQQAIERLERGGYSAVLMDCQMPVLDGYGATRAWRRQEQEQRLKRLPIIAMTANAMAGDRQKCLDAGMDDYLAKPVTRQQLEATLGRWLSTVETTPSPAGSASPSRPAATSSAQPPAPVPARPAEPPLSAEIIEDLKQLMGAEFLKLVRLFLEDAPGHLGKLRQAARAGDLASLVAPAHTLKSASANLGALAFSAQAKRIELGARVRELSDPVGEVDHLLLEWNRVEEALREQL